MKCVVGTLNPVKIKAVENVLTGFYPEITIEGMRWGSGVDQPMGLEQTVQGAVERSKKAHVLADMGVGIESGLIQVPGTASGYFDIHFCAITDDERTTLGSSSGFEYPEDVIEEVKKGLDIEEVFQKLHGIEKIGQKGGAVEYLSAGSLTRIELIEQSVRAAMVPRLHQDYTK